MRKTLRTAAFLAGIYQLLILVHIGLIFFFPAVNPSFMISVEALYAIGWFGWCFFKNLHEAAGKVPFAGGLGGVYAVLQLAPRILRRLDLPVNLHTTLYLLLTAETAFLGMLLIVLTAKHNLPYEGPEL